MKALLDRCKVVRQQSLVAAKKVGTTTWTVGKHPITALLLSLVTFYLGIQFTKSEKEPVFTVSRAALVATTSESRDKLKILWDKKVVSNVATVKIGVWNQGKALISKEDLTVADPIRLVPTEKADILDVTVVKKSRENLQVRWEIQSGKDDSKSVLVDIVGDEALENKDGVLLQVLYAVPSTEVLCSCQWSVAGRVKGTKSGFVNRNWGRLFYRAENSKSGIILSLIFAALLLMIFIEAQNIKKKSKKPYELIGIVILLVFTGTILHQKRIYAQMLEAPAPSWLLDASA
jgi:hypothetical protein